MTLWGHKLDRNRQGHGRDGGTLLEVLMDAEVTRTILQLVSLMFCIVF